MKNVLIISILIVSVLSCTDDGINGPIFDLENTSITEPSFISESTSNGGILSGEVASDTFEVFSWNAATYNNLSIVINYTAQVSATEEFTDPMELFTTSSTNRVVTNGEINAMMLSLGLPANAESTFYLRLLAKPDATGLSELDSLVSDTLNRSATSFVAVADPIFFVGGGSAAGWNNPADPIVNHYPLFPDVENITSYSYTGFFLNDGFKILDFPDGSWSNQYGAGDPGQLSRDGGSGNLSTGAEGYFTITADIENLTWSSAPFDESSANDYTDVGIGITGEAAGGWDEFPTRYSLTQSSFDKHIWFATGVTFTEGEFKFKQDSPGWGVQFGAVENGANNWPYDKASGGANLAATPGTYTVYFNDLTGDYWMIEE